MKKTDFPFFESYHRSFQSLSPEIVGKVVQAMGFLYFDDKEVELDGVAQAVFDLIKPILEKKKYLSEVRSEASTGHGAPKNNQNAVKNQSKTNKNNQTTNKNQTKTNGVGVGVGVGVRSKDIGVWSKEEEIQAAVADTVPFVDYEAVVSDYNNTCKSLPQVKSLSDARRKAIKARVRTRGLEEIHQAFVMAEQSSFLKGSNKNNWTASFDWIMNDTNMAKILDGNYENRTPSGNEDGADWLLRQIKGGTLNDIG